MPADVDDPPLPPHLQLEITSACNLRCVMCLVRYRPPANKLAGAMPLDLFRRLVDDVPTLKMLTLQGLGEPLLSPYLLGHDPHRCGAPHPGRVQLQRHVADRPPRRRAREQPVDWLHVSLDGASAAAYEKVRDGASLDAVLTNLGPRRTSPAPAWCNPAAW